MFEMWKKKEVCFALFGILGWLQQLTFFTQRSWSEVNDRRSFLDIFWSLSLRHVYKTPTIFLTQSGFSLLLSFREVVLASPKFRGQRGLDSHSQSTEISSNSFVQEIQRRIPRLKSGKSQNFSLSLSSFPETFSGSAVIHFPDMDTKLFSLLHLFKVIPACQMLPKFMLQHGSLIYNCCKYNRQQNCACMSELNHAMSLLLHDYPLCDPCFQGQRPDPGLFYSLA